MKISELLEKYDFHDSLLEKVYFKEEELILEIDFCRWRQDFYVEGEKETEEIMIVFRDVSVATLPDFKLNSDEIMDAILVNKEKDVEEIKLMLYNDIKESVYFVTICAKEVEVK